MNILIKAVPFTALLLAGCNMTDKPAEQSETANAAGTSVAEEKSVLKNSLGDEVGKAGEKDQAAETPADEKAEKDGDNAKADGNNNRCKITTDGSTDFDGACRFSAEKRGSFAVDLANEDVMFDEIVMVQMTITSKGKAMASGLTTHGVSSNWGEYRRMASDKACWKSVNENSIVCAY